MKENQMNQELLTHIIDFVKARDTGLSPLYSKRVRARAWDRAKEAKRRAFEAARKADSRGPALLRAKCIVHGCTNHTDEGKFVGNLCAPCHSMITGGMVGFTDSFLRQIPDLQKQVKELEAKAEEARAEARYQVEMKKEAVEKVEKLRAVLRDCRDTFRHIIDNTPIGLSPFSTDTLALVEQVLGETA